MDNNLRATLARNVAALRKYHGLTQTELAQRTGHELGQTSVSAIEREIHSATVETIEALARAFRISPWLLLLPDLDPATAMTSKAGKILETYIALPADGRAQVERVADAEARYQVIPKV